MSHRTVHAKDIPVMGYIVVVLLVVLLSFFFSFFFCSGRVFW